MSGGSVTVNGTWQSNFFTPGNYRIEVFADDTADPSNHGEGQIFLGEQSFLENTSSFSFSIQVGAFFNDVGRVVSCTITDPLNNTSEFSNDV